MQRLAMERWVQSECMGVEYPDLPGWEFTTKQVSEDEFLIRVVGPGGVTAESRVVEDPDDCIEEMRQWARRTGLGGASGSAL
jgi:hypothetical protein